jgi:hypothetical protein
MLTTVARGDSDRDSISTKNPRSRPDDHALLQARPYASAASAGCRVP